MASTFGLERGLLNEELRKTNGRTVTDNYGNECDVCPFCGNAIPLEASVCRGCGANRRSEVFQKSRNIALIFFLVMLAITCLGMLASILL